MATKMVDVSGRVVATECFFGNFFSPIFEEFIEP